MQAVADDAGVTKPVVYAAFDGKDALFRALLAREEERILAEIQGAFANADLTDPETTLTDGFTGFLRAVGESPKVYQLIFLGEGGGNAAVARRIQRGRQAQADALSLLAKDWLDAEEGQAGGQREDRAPARQRDRRASRVRRPPAALRHRRLDTGDARPRARPSRRQPRSQPPEHSRPGRDTQEDHHYGRRDTAVEGGGGRAGPAPGWRHPADRRRRPPLRRIGLRAASPGHPPDGWSGRQPALGLQAGSLGAAAADARLHDRGHLRRTGSRLGGGQAGARDAGRVSRASAPTARNTTPSIRSPTPGCTRHWPRRSSEPTGSSARPRLNPVELEEFWREWRRMGRLVGVRYEDLPESWPEMLAYFDEMVRTRLEDTEAAQDVIAALRDPASPLPWLRGPIWRAVRWPPATAAELATIGPAPAPASRAARDPIGARPRRSASGRWRGSPAPPGP